MSILRHSAVTMYLLYGAPGRASAAPEALLEEIGVDYEYVHVDPKQLGSNEAYRKVNPLAQLPALVHGDRTIWEAAAICLYLCDRHPEAQLAPVIEAPDRGRFYQWLVFLSNTLQPAYMLFFYPDRYCSDPHGARVVGKDAEARITKLWQQLEDALVPGPFLLGERMSACDVYLHMLSTWHRESIVSLTAFPRAHRLLALVAERPGVQRMLLRNAGH